jgi:hypothetical protein
VGVARQLRLAAGECEALALPLALAPPDAVSVGRGEALPEGGALAEWVPPPPRSAPPEGEGDPVREALPEGVAVAQAEGGALGVALEEAPLEADASRVAVAPCCEGDAQPRAVGDAQREAL